MLSSLHIKHLRTAELIEIISCIKIDGEVKAVKSACLEVKET